MARRESTSFFMLNVSERIETFLAEYEFSIAVGGVSRTISPCEPGHALTGGWEDVLNAIITELNPSTRVTSSRPLALLLEGRVERAIHPSHISATIPRVMLWYKGAGYSVSLGPRDKAAWLQDQSGTVILRYDPQQLRVWTKFKSSSGEQSAEWELSTGQPDLNLANAINTVVPGAIQIPRDLPKSSHDVKGRRAAIFSPTGLQCNAYGLNFGKLRWGFEYKHWFDKKNPPFIRFQGEEFEFRDDTSTEWIARLKGGRVGKQEIAMREFLGIKKKRPLDEITKSESKRRKE